MNFDIADVPKLAAKIPYFPPEMVYDAIHGGDESLQLLTHNSLMSTTPESALRRSDRMLQSPFKSIGDFLGGQSQSHNPDGFVPDWDSWRQGYSKNRRMDTGTHLTPFSEVEIDHNFGTKPLGVVPSRSVPSQGPSISPIWSQRPEERRIMPSTAPPGFSFEKSDLRTTKQIEDMPLKMPTRFPFGTDDNLRTTHDIEDNISMDFREPVGRITYDTKANSETAVTSPEGERPFIPSEEDFFSGLDRPNASEFELQKAEMDAVFDGLKKETAQPGSPGFSQPGNLDATQPRIMRTTAPPVYVPKRTYVPPKRLPPPPPPPPPQSVVPSRGGAPNPKYLEFDPMAFARRRGPNAEEQG